MTLMADYCCRGEVVKGERPVHISRYGGPDSVLLGKGMLTNEKPKTV